MSNKKHWLALAALVSFLVPATASADAYSDGYMQNYGSGKHGHRGVGYYGNSMVTPSGARQVQLAPAVAVGGMSLSTANAAGDYMHDVCKEGTFTWTKNSFPLKVYIEDGSNVPGYRANFNQYIVDAFNTWDQVTDHKLSWSQVSSPQDADITIRWTDAVTERVEGTEAGRTAAVTRLNPATGIGTISGAKMQFLTRLPQRQFSDEEVKKTCLHEVGHALGLQGHSTNRDDIMYYAVSPTQGTLTSRDITTMNKLYESYPAPTGSATMVTLGPKPRRGN